MQIKFTNSALKSEILYFCLGKVNLTGKIQLQSELALATNSVSKG